MNGADSINDVERLFARGRELARADSQGREFRLEATLAAGFLLAAIAIAVLFSSPRDLEWPALAILGVTYIVACRAKFDIADGYTVPTELVLVPAAFILPTPFVPLVICAYLVLGRLPDYLTGVTNFRRSFHLLGDCWHTVGPTLVICAFGAQELGWDRWPIYVLALASQFAFDFAVAAVRAWAIERTAPRELLGSIAPVYALDAALAPIGFVLAFAAVQIGAAACLLAIPLAGILAVLSRERQARIDHALELSDAYRGTAVLLGDVVEADDAYTGSHSRGVVELALMVSDRLGLDSRRRRNVEFAALLHDVGKIAVPKEIINKTGPLDEDEWEIMRRHTIEGERMLKRVGGVLGEVGEIVRASHEDFDGSGYPDGLAGEQIPIEARIVSCCDAFSAMTTNRSYRAAMPTADAIAEFRAHAGTQFDPLVAETLIRSL